MSTFSSDSVYSCTVIFQLQNQLYVTNLKIVSHSESQMNRDSLNYVAIMHNYELFSLS